MVTDCRGCFPNVEIWRFGPARPYRIGFLGQQSPCQCRSGVCLRRIRPSMQHPAQCGVCSGLTVLTSLRSQIVARSFWALWNRRWVEVAPLSPLGMADSPVTQHGANSGEAPAEASPQEQKQMEQAYAQMKRKMSMAEIGTKNQAQSHGPCLEKEGVGKVDGLHGP